MFKPAIIWNPLCVPLHVDSYSPSWKKPKAFLEHIAPKIEEDGIPVFKSTSAIELLKRVHDPKYLKEVLSGVQPNGFGSHDPKVAEACTYTCGAMVEGVMRSIEGYSSCVPVSGFHHAGHDFGGGFCTFNGLALAAVVAQEFDMKPGVLDLDMHYGNGTVDIFSALGIENTPHYTYGGTSYANRNMGDEFLKDLPEILRSVFGECKVLLYQAGMDPFIKDPLGGCLTEWQLIQRDTLVFAFARDRGIPVVWDLAGGYTKPFSKVLELHANTYDLWLKYCDHKQPEMV